MSLNHFMKRGDETMIEIYVRNGDKEASLKTETLSAKQIEILIEQIFGVLTSNINEEQKRMIFKPNVPDIHNHQREQEPEHWKTGVMHKDGVPLYRLRLECPYCGMKKNLYREIGVETVECVQCNMLVKVEPATEKGFGTTEEHRDKFGNFMLAKKPYSRPRVLPKVGSENRSTFSIADLIGGDVNVVEQSG